MKHLIYYIKERGFKFAFNLFYYHIFWGKRNTLLIKYPYWFKPYPSYIEIEVTTRCNMKCIMCEHTYWNEPEKDMSFKEFRYIIDQFPRLKWVGLTGIGESFLNKDFMRMLEYVKSRSVLVEIYDNFHFLDKEIAQELIWLKIDSIYASIDAATKKTYEKIRLGGDFDKVIKNVREFLDLKRKYGVPLTTFNFHYIIGKLNIQEVLSYLDLVYSLAKGLEVNVQFTRMLHKYKEAEDLFVEMDDKLIEEVGKKAKALGIGIFWNANIRRPKPSPDRCIEWTMPFIFVTGDVIPCCAGNEANRRDFQKEYSLGNIFEKSFKEIWNGKKYRELRKSLYKGKFPFVCRDCCLYEEKLK